MSHWPGKLAVEHIWAELKLEQEFWMFFDNRTMKINGKNLIMEYYKLGI